MEFRLLGPLEVAENGHVLAVGGAKERTLLAVLLLHANETVSTEQLIDELWGERPPRSAARLVATHVWQLRKTFGDTIVTRAPGYAAVVPEDRLDVRAFERLLQQARSLPPAEASATLAEALALWRGPALQDVRFESVSARAVERLEDERLDTIALRIDQDLALGRHEAVLLELQALVDAEPYRERLQAQLMLALYRSGRQADALAVYRDFRGRSVEELGIEPGPALQELERGILRQDPSLAARAPKHRSAPRRGRRLGAAVAAVVLLAVAAVGLVASRGAEPGVAVGTNAVAVVDPDSGRVVAGVPLGLEPGAIVSGTTSVWAAAFADRNVAQIDPRSRAVVRRVAVEGSPTSLATTGRTLWAISRFDRTVTAVDLEFYATRSEPLPTAGVTFDDPQVRRPTGADAALGRLRIGSTDAALLDGRGREVAALAYPIPDVALGRGSLWAVGTPPRLLSFQTPGDVSTPGVVYRLDPVTGDVESETPVGRQPNGIAIGLGFVWVVNSDDGTLERLHPVTGTSLERIPLGEPPIGLGPVFDPRAVGSGGGLAVGEGSVWVTDGRRNALIRYEPGSGRITRIPLDASPADVAVGHGLVWVTLRRAAGG